MNVQRCLLGFLGFYPMFAVAVFADAPAQKPNVLIILSDDQSYRHAGFQGNPEALTPNLDALAKSGVRCTNGYTSGSFCSPTRAGLLTGRYQTRFGHDDNPLYDPLDEKQGLPLSEKLLPQFLKEAGYRTGWVGKWHLGASPKHVPWARGFDECFGFIGGGHKYQNWMPDGHQYTLPLVRDGKELPDVPKHMTDTLGDEAVAFIQRGEKQPWMLYLAFNAPHAPLEPTSAWLDKYQAIRDPARRKNLAQVSQMDAAIGRVVKSLSDSGQSERTLIFFLGDNGGAIRGMGGDNAPLRSEKGHVYEGGIRVPFLVSWPGHVPADKTYNEPVISLDILATALAVAGLETPKDKIYDGVNLLPYLDGTKTGSPHERLFWRSTRQQQEGRPDFAIREGKWKLVHENQKPIELYDLSADESEKQDLAAEHPEIVARMSAALDSWKKELVPPAFKGGTYFREDWGPGGKNATEKQRLDRQKTN